MAGGCCCTLPAGAPCVVSKERSSSGVLHAAVEINRWLQSLPDVAETRPARCPRCHVAARRPGRPLAIHGHGVVTRHLWGPPALGHAPEFGELRLRRYRCLECRAVIRVGPRGVFSRRRYSATAIGLALWAVLGRTAPEGSGRRQSMASRRRRDQEPLAVADAMDPSRAVPAAMADHPPGRRRARATPSRRDHHRRHRRRAPRLDPRTGLRGAGLRRRSAPRRDSVA